jgi:hypothetical protein
MLTERWMTNDGQWIMNDGLWVITMDDERWVMMIDERWVINDG